MKKIVTRKSWTSSKQIYKNYDFTLLPSFKEGYPSVVLESMNQGTPLVLSNLPSLMEMVEHSAIFFGTK